VDRKDPEQFRVLVERGCNRETTYYPDAPAGLPNFSNRWAVTMVDAAGNESQRRVSRMVFAAIEKEWYANKNCGAIDVMVRYTNDRPGVDVRTQAVSKEELCKTK
jgi:hypothetical protein